MYPASVFTYVCHQGRFSMLQHPSSQPYSRFPRGGRTLSRKPSPGLKRGPQVERTRLLVHQQDGAVIEAQGGGE